MDFDKYGALHEGLSGTPAIRLAKMHLELIRAASKMERARFVEPEDPSKPHTIQETEFGRQVVDELTWWVSTNVPRLHEMREKAHSAEQAAQRLVGQARLLRDRHEPGTYGYLVDELAGWCRRNEADIAQLADFVIWLRGCGELGPSTLFSYRVWGTSRRSDRQLPPGASYEESAQLLQTCFEWVLGLRGHYWLTVVHVAMNRLDALASSVDPEREDAPLVVAYEDIRHRVAYDVLSRLVSYLELVRDSCRQLIGEVAKRMRLDALLDDEGFWNRFIAAVTADGRTEDQHWDLKETLPMWRAAAEAKRKAEHHFCELVAAFANAEGGVFVVGVTDTPPRRVVGVIDVENKIKDVYRQVRLRADLPDSAIRAKEVLCETADGATVRCIVVAVARTRHPVSVRDDGDHYSYPIRRGPGFERWSHAQVAESKRSLQGQDWDFVRHLVAVAEAAAGAS